MDPVRDYTIRNGLGIRVSAAKTCRVIRYIGKQWVEIGVPYSLPVDRSLLIWTETGIPAGILAVALRVFELDNPETHLREILTEGAQRGRKFNGRSVGHLTPQISGVLLPTC